MTKAKKAPERAAADKSVMLFVTSPTTVAAFVRPIAETFGARGWRVVIVSGAGEGLDETAAAVGALGVPLSFQRGVSPVQNFLALVDAVRIVRRHKPRLVMSATPVAGLVGAAAGRIARARVIHLAWGLRSESMAPPMRAIMARLEALTTSLAHATVANSASLASVIKSTNRRSRVVVLGNGSSHGVDLTRFAFVPPPDHDCPVVAFVGRVRRDKGICELLEAAKILERRNRKVALRIYGEVEEHDLVSMIEGAPNVAYADFVQDVPRVMADSDILCLPTWREGFPNVALEAAATGRPVVTTTATGAIDSVVDGVTGLVVPPANAPLLADALDRLISDRRLRWEMGSQGRTWAEAHFAERLVCERLVAFADSEAS